jgi:hypothetical protein
MIKWKRPRLKVHSTGNFITDITRMFRFLGKRGSGGGRLSKFFAKIAKEMRRE